MSMLLGAATTVAVDTLLDTFLDFISASERQTSFIQKGKGFPSLFTRAYEHSFYVWLP